MKKYRGFSVDVVANGFIASIGCQRLVFKTMEEVAEAVADYAKDPDGAAAKILKNSFVDDMVAAPLPGMAMLEESD